MEKQSLYIFNFSIFLLKIVIFIIIVGVSFSFVFEKVIIFKSQTNGASKVNRILSTTIKDEIPIFGSSRAQGNFVPSIINDKCYNYGIDGTQANIWLFFLEEELKKNKNAPIILNFDLFGLIYDNGDIGNYIPNWNATNQILVGEGEYYYQIPFVKYYGQYEKYLKDYINEKINLTKITDKGGSFEKNKLTKQKFQELILEREISTSSFILNKQLLQKFYTLINSTKRNIIIVISPYHISNFNKFENIDKADKFLKDLSTLNNITVVDLRNFIVEDDLFINTTHLNYEGAVKFSKKLKEVLILSDIQPKPSSNLIK